MVCFATKANAPIKIKTIVKYRSYRKFDQEKFEQDLSSAPFHVCTVFDSVNDCYAYVKQLYVDVINAHAPLKTRVITYKEAPYMNDQLCKSMNVRNHFRRKWERVDSKENRAIYVKHRNSTMRLRKQSMLCYLQKNCINTTHCSSKQYWTILKPFMSLRAQVEIARYHYWRMIKLLTIRKK